MYRHILYDDYTGGGQAVTHEYVWQWPENDGSWHDYDDDMQTKLRDLEVGKKITFSAGQWTYEISKTSASVCSYVYIYMIVLGDKIPYVWFDVNDVI